MRVPNATHLGRPWRIHEVVPDFRLLDVWSHPGITGSAEDFDAVVELVTSLDPMTSSSRAARFLWKTRDLLGRWFDLGAVTGGADSPTLPIPGTTETSLRDRLPLDLRATADPADSTSPFRPLYRTADEYAAEISNRTVHGVIHLGWVPDGDGRFHGQMAIYVRPRGRLGSAYLAFIKPFRHLVVYPALERELARAWEERRPT